MRTTLLLAYNPYKQVFFDLLNDSVSRPGVHLALLKCRKQDWFCFRRWSCIPVVIVVTSGYWSEIMGTVAAIFGASAAPKCGWEQIFREVQCGLSIPFLSCCEWSGRPWDVNGPAPENYRQITSAHYRCMLAYFVSDLTCFPGTSQLLTLPKANWMGGICATGIVVFHMSLERRPVEGWVKMWKLFEKF